MPPSRATGAGAPSIPPASAPGLAHGHQTIPLFLRPANPQANGYGAMDPFFASPVSFHTEQNAVCRVADLGQGNFATAGAVPMQSEEETRAIIQAAQTPGPAGQFTPAAGLQAPPGGAPQPPGSLQSMGLSSILGSIPSLPSELQDDMMQ